jgi:hypothetical protein
MGNNKHGFELEDILIEHINKSIYFDNLNENIKNFINSIFRYNLKGKIIKASKGASGTKVDMVIVCENLSFNVSIKIGAGNSVHQENFNLFAESLREYSFNEKAIIYLKEFQYGEQVDKFGKKTRLDSGDLRIIMKNEIDIINREFNDETKLVKLLDRFVFQGKEIKYPKIHFLYYGDLEKGIWASREEIINFFKSSRPKDKTIHIGKLNYQVWNRNMKMNPKYEYKRNVMQVKWSSLKKDLVSIRNEK